MAENPSSAVEADVLYCGFQVGYFSKSDIEHWADNQIAEAAAPSDSLLELAILRHTHPLDVLKLLDSIRRDARADQSVANHIGFIGLCFAENKITLQNAVRGLYALTWEDGITELEKGAIYSLDDAYDRAVAGEHGSFNDVEEELRSFLQPYANSLKARHAAILRRSVE